MYVKYTNMEGFAVIVTYSIMTILAGPQATQEVPQPTQEIPQPSQGATPPTSGVYSSNPAVAAKYGMFVHFMILATVN